MTALDESGPGLLEDLTVIDLAAGISGSYCAKLLADLGAVVVKVEPPGQPALAEAERLPGEPADERAANWAFLPCNTGKFSVTLDPQADRGHEVLLRLLATASVAIADPESGCWDLLL